MASSDEEDGALPLSVSNYHIEDDESEPVSLSSLPVIWKESERADDKTTKLFLRGFADNGLCPIHKHVVAWRFSLSNVNKPEITALSKDNSWFKLEKPRKVFEGTIRSVLVTVHSLHFMQRNPESSKKSLWDYLSKTFSSYEVGPSENDLRAHTSLIAEALERIDSLRKAKFLVEFLKEPLEKGVSDEGIQATKPMKKFIVDDSEDDDSNDGGEDDESEDGGLFDSVCCICDNGGELLCCEGSCIRSFHANVDDAEDCETLGFSKAKVKTMETQEFLCDNCKYKKHQCFACGKLGSSDKFSGAEVFRCVNAFCGQFYHPHCVAKMLHPDDKVAAEDQEKNIASGESFTCPVHRCAVCKQGENKKDSQLQFAVCRRCPKSYHRKCLPRKISFTSIEEEGIVQRAWEDLLPNRILIYCLKHEIDEDVGTPLRNHIKFPRVEEKKSVVLKERHVSDEKRKKRIDLGGLGKKFDLKRKVYSEEPSQERTAPLRKIRKLASDQSLGKLTSGSSRIPKVVKKVYSVAKNDPKAVLGNRLYEAYGLKIEPSDHEEQRTEDDDLSTEIEINPETHGIDDDSQKRVLDIMKSAKSTVTMEVIRSNQALISTSIRKHFDEKSVTLGKVEASVGAVREAVHRLDQGGRIEDAADICSRDIIEQIYKWRSKLRNHIGPFLIGRRYTSFGRHFTKPEKIQEIVNRLHWYLQDGDTLVDFACGSNDFSVFMEKKLKEMGKKCYFKNYDILPPKKDFNVEIRDWMGVKRTELPAGSKLVMGLNPPFGVRGIKAWQFIEKALEFNPKLLILIAPPETTRLDAENKPYNLIWEDDHLLSGKAFYLPGSINASDKQMDQWCTTPPLLYLWSHRDWSAKHRNIAKAKCHISKAQPNGITRFKYHHVDADLPMADISPNVIDKAQLSDDKSISSPDHIETDAVKSEEHNEILPSDSAAGILVVRRNDLVKQRRVSKKNKKKKKANNRVLQEPRYDNGNKDIVPYNESDNVIMHPRNESAEENYRHSSHELAVHDPSPIHDAGMPLHSNRLDDFYHHSSSVPLYYDNGPAARSSVRESHHARSSLLEGVYSHSYSTPRVGDVRGAVAHSYGGQQSMEELELKYLTPRDEHRLGRLSGDSHPDTGYRPQFTGGYSPRLDTRLSPLSHIPAVPSGYESNGLYGVAPVGSSWPQTRSTEELHHNRVSNLPLQHYASSGYGPLGFRPAGPTPYGNPGGPGWPGPRGRFP